VNLAISTKAAEFVRDRGSTVMVHMIPPLG